MRYETLCSRIANAKATLVVLHVLMISHAYSTSSPSRGSTNLELCVIFECHRMAVTEAFSISIRDALLHSQRPHSGQPEAMDWAVSKT
jgi:hypothetical protein